MTLPAPNSDVRKSTQEELHPSTLLYPTKLFGQKSGLVARILEHLPQRPGTFIDAFGGTGVVAYEAKHRGWKIAVNDILGSLHLRHQVLVENSRTTLCQQDVDILTSTPRHSNQHCQRLFGAFLGEDNARFFDTWAANIPELGNIEKRRIAELMPILSVSRPAKFFKVGWTFDGRPTGLDHLPGKDLAQDIRKWTLNVLPELIFDNGCDNKAVRGDAIDVISRTDADVCYVDSPYCSPGGKYQSDLAFYDTLLEVMRGNGSGISDPRRWRPDLPEHTRFDLRKSAIAGYARLFSRAWHIPLILVSYNSTSRVSPTEIRQLAEDYGRTVDEHLIPWRLPKTDKEADGTTTEVILVCRLEDAERAA